MAILLDGAVGTSLWEIAQKNGCEKVPVWRYNVEHPEFVRELHDSFIDAGSKIILANTFGANRLMVDHEGFDIEKVITSGVRIAKECANGKDVKVALAIGPLSQLLQPFGTLSEQDAADIFSEQISLGMKENPDLIMLQTFIDLRMMKIALSEAKKYDVPVFATMSFQKKGKTIMGDSVKDVCDSLDVDAIGINCSLGPDYAANVIREFKEYTTKPLIFKPNAGMPIGKGLTKDYDPATFVNETKNIIGLIDYVGGCCGCNSEYIKALSSLTFHSY